MGRYRFLGLFAFIGLFYVGYSGWIGNSGGINPEELPLLDALLVDPAETVESHVLQRGQTLDRVLYRAGFAGNELHSLVLAVRQFVNPRVLPVGLEVRVRRWYPDGETRALEMRLNADTMVVLAPEQSAGWDGSVVVTPVTVDTVYMAGVIQQGGSLYRAIMSDESVDMRPADRDRLVDHLANTYAFTLAFSHQIRAGDSYRLAFQREVRPDGSMRRGRVLVAEIQNRGRILPAIYFDAPDVAGYYDRGGEALQRAFLRAPLEYRRITSSFSHSRFHPVLGVNRPHIGVDFGAPTGTRVYATADGVVASAGWDGGYGNVVRINHAGGYRTLYAHLSRFAAGMRAGRRVGQGELIGYVGATGLATGPHLHYELHRSGVPLNPMTVELPGAPPIPSALRDQFAEIKSERLKLLERAGPQGSPGAAGTSVAEQADQVRQ